jgi:hypothetical protein
VSRPVDPGADYAAVVDGLDELTVQQVGADEATVTATSENVTCLKKTPRRETAQVGDGEVGAEACGFTLVASGLSFVPRTRDRITDADGVTWSIGDVTVGGFGTLYYCENCTKLR